MNQSSASFLNKRRAARSFSCSQTESLSEILLANQSCLAARPSLSHLRHLGVRDIRVCRPSFGSGIPLTRPACWRGVITALIDCGRMPSARARLDTVAGPLSSRRSTTDNCDGVRSLCCPSARRCRLTLRNTVRISRATVEASSVFGKDAGWLTEQVFHVYRLPVKVNCICAARALLLGPVERRISQRAHYRQIALPDEIGIGMSASRQLSRGKHRRQHLLLRSGTPGAYRNLSVLSREFSYERGCQAEITPLCVPARGALWLDILSHRKTHARSHELTNRPM